MKRGEIYFANLDPSIGSETAKCRPVLIVSNDINNQAATTRFEHFSLANGIQS